MKHRNEILIIIFSLLGTVVSAILIEHHVHPATDSEFLQAVCDTDGQSGCAAVNQSEASSFLGMPIAFWGFLFYALVLCFAAFHIKYKQDLLMRLIFWLGFLAVLVDITLLLYSLIVVDAICNLCVVTYLATAGIFAVALLSLRASHPQEGLFKIDFDFSWLKAQPVAATMMLFSCVVVVFLGSFVYLYAKSSSDTLSSSHGHDALLEEAWKSFQREYEALPEKEIPIEHSPYKGASEPVITIVEFADFLCPHCKIAGLKLKTIIEKYKNSVKVVFKNYPLDQTCNQNIKRKFHSGACKISYMALCASRQKTDSFWKAHDEIFNQHEEWRKLDKIPDSAFMSVLRKSNVNLKNASACLRAEKTKQEVIRDIELGDSLGVTSTPTLFINGKKLQGGLPNDYFFEKLLAYEVQKQMGKN